MTSSGFLKKFILELLIVLAVIAGVVIFFDPFYHYHKPVLGMKQILNDKEYQCIGSLRNFDYDALLVGSSVAENFNNRWFEEEYNCTLEKAIRASGTTADLTYYVNEVYQNHDLKHIFYNVDTSALYASPKTTFRTSGQPMYLYDHNPLTDIRYWWNKDVLLKKIPYQLVYSYVADYDEGESYNWAKWKSFGVDQVKRAYTPSETIEEMRKSDSDLELLTANLEMLTALVENHLETEFTFYFPPYSLVWWDEAYRTGNLERNLYGQEQTIKALLSFPNVKVYYFCDDADTILNLDNYMDTLHFSEEITYQIFEDLGNPEYELTLDNLDDHMENMREIVDQIEQEEISKYY
ncbi:MAG: SGNH/GDSL hydrolase family protein [Lachnospiraceae bacterium]|nr:SGNH/GDSL hydrolase family protein [Lachnospiraceae bacterium]